MLKTLLHFHTEQSRFDSVAKLRDMCKRAKELGYTTLGITEHGVLTNSFDFMEICQENGLKGIPGVETYIGEKHSHLCLFPMSEKGYFAIAKAVTESYQNVSTSGLPLMSKEILKKYFGPNGEGHNEVIASSACVGGVLANVYNSNKYIQKEIDHKQKNLNEAKNGSNKTLQKLKISWEKAYEIHDEVKQKKEQLENIKQELKKQRKLTKTPYKKEEKIFLSFQKGDDGYELAKKNYEEKKEIIKQATSLVATLEQEQNEIREFVQTNKKVFDCVEKQLSKLDTLRDEIKVLEETLLPPETLYQNTVKEAQWFMNTFGEHNFYVEIQYHGIKDEERIMPPLITLSKELNLPLIATNDAHMVTGSKKEIKAREYIRAMRFKKNPKWVPASKEDGELYVKGAQEFHDFLSGLFQEEDIKNAFAGCEEIASRCNVVFSKQEHYPVFPCKTNAADYLREMCQKGIKEKFKPEEWTQEYQDRMERELDVIIKMGYADYHCIVSDYIVYGKLIGQIDFSKYEEEYLKNPYNMEYLQELVDKTGGVGEGIGPGRGSAAGSLVCYLIGITDVDPIKYNLLFERFLNVERVSMPDIDTDFSPDIREKVINYVRYKYGEEAVCMILTFGSMQARKAIRNVARIYGLEKKGNEEQNTTAFASLADELCKTVPNELNVKFKDFLYDEIIKDTNGNEVYKQGVRTAYKDNADAINILDIAESMEGCFVDYGMHAAGVVIADSHPVQEYIPLMCNDGVNWVSQCDKERVEDRGLLKMDFLGLKNLRIITRTLRSIQKHTGKRIDIQKIDYNDPEVLKEYANGFTNAVFQVESPGMKSINMEFKPQSFEDIILIIAAYRPGPMDFIPDIIAVKNGEKEPNYPIPEMGEILDVTYGCPVYQEQIMNIFHQFAGFSLGQADIVRRYMSKKKVDKFLAFKDDFVNGLVERGAERKAAEDYWESLVNFSKYAFNKSHATAYAIVSYQTAWLKHYYPREYISAYLSDLDTDGISNKIRSLEQDLKDLDYAIIPPDINLSNEDFDLYDNNVIYGLGSIRGIKDGVKQIIEERNSNGPFKSIQDFAVRVMPNKKVLSGLLYGGAFDSLHPNRAFYIQDSFIEQITDGISAIKKQKTEESKAKKIEELYMIEPEKVREDEQEILRLEKHYLGSYFSKNPLDTLPKATDVDCVPIENLCVTKQTHIMGIITDLRIVARKKDNANMAFFTLEDQTGKINCCCFVREYASYASFVQEGAKIKITGSIKEDENFYSSKKEEEENPENEEEKIFQCIIKKIEPINERKDGYLLSVANIIDWQTMVQHQVRPYIADNEHPLFLYDRMTGRIRETVFSVREDIKEKFEVMGL